MSTTKIRLGRGLGNLIAGGRGPTMKPVEAASAPAPVAPATPLPPVGNSGGLAGFAEISIATIDPSPYQPRREFEAEALGELAESIRSEGLLQPIVVRRVKERHELIAGERRMRACQKLGMKTIVARVMDASDASSAVISLIENLQRQNLNPIEEALGYASLLRDFSLTQEAVAERVGKGRATVANSLRLLALEREVQGFLSKGLLSTGHAKVLLGVEAGDERGLLARRAIENSWSVRDLEVEARKLKADTTVKSGGRTEVEAESRVIRDLEKRLGTKLNTRVSFKHAGKKGKIVIEYFSNDDLQRILEQLGLGM